MFRNKSVNVHQFAMVPRSDVPRSSFQMQKTVKTTFDSGWLVPILVEEVLPGDTFKLSMTAFARMATPIFPVMDNLYLESFFFFVPNRLVWQNWVRFMGEQDNPTDSISYVVPTIVSPVGGYPVGGLYDQMGLPTVGQVGAGNTFSHSALPLRGYALIYNQWFRDENLSQSFSVPRDDGPDPYTYYQMQRRGKRHDYFTGALPWVQKGSAVTLPLGLSAPVKSSGGGAPTFQQAGGAVHFGQLAARYDGFVKTTNVPSSDGQQLFWDNPGLYADLSAATSATINQLRQSFQIQRLLERDARGGTRYTEIIRSHFGVVSPDARLQRPEYLGGGSNPITINPIAQTSATSAAGSNTPLASLAAFGTSLSHNHGFTQSFTEHGYVIGIINVRADLTYQQGLRRHWSRQTRYDFYFPAFANLGEQSILNKEIYLDGSANDNNVFGYQERWAEYRYNPSEIRGLFKSTSAGAIDQWHLAQRFASLPVLNNSFIQDVPPVQRVLAVGTAAGGQEFLCDAFFNIQAARPMPLYSVPGLVDHF